MFQGECGHKLTLQLFDNFENDTLAGARLVSGSQVGVEGRYPRASVLFSNQMGVEDGASVYLFVKTRSMARPVPLHLPLVYRPVSNGNRLIVLDLVPCLFIHCLDYKAMGCGGSGPGLGQIAHIFPPPRRPPRLSDPFSTFLLN